MHDEQPWPRWKTPIAMERPPDPPVPPEERARLAERFFQLARDEQLTATEREEFCRMARSWTNTLPAGSEKERLLSLDEGQGN